VGEHHQVPRVGIPQVLGNHENRVRGEKRHHCGALSGEQVEHLVHDHRLAAKIATERTVQQEVVEKNVWPPELAAEELEHVVEVPHA